MPERNTPIAAGRRAYHVARVQTPTVRSVAGEYAEDFADSPPVWYVALEERAGVDDTIKTPQGVVLAQTTIVVTGPYRADVVPGVRLIDELGRVLYVIGASQPASRPFELECTCGVVQGETAQGTR